VPASDDIREAPLGSDGRLTKFRSSPVNRPRPAGQSFEPFSIRRVIAAAVCAQKPPVKVPYSSGRRSSITGGFLILMANGAAPLSIDLEELR
jgi:hypothetical protein